MREPEFLRVRHIVEYDRNQVLVLETETRFWFWKQKPRFNFGIHIGAETFLYLFEFFCTFSDVFTLLSVLKSLKLKKIK